MSFWSILANAANGGGGGGHYGGADTNSSGDRLWRKPAGMNQHVYNQQVQQFHQNMAKWRSRHGYNADNSLKTPGKPVVRGR
jgi:hypothetical protein